MLFVLTPRSGDYVTGIIRGQLTAGTLEGLAILHLTACDVMVQ